MRHIHPSKSLANFLKIYLHKLIFNTDPVFPGLDSNESADVIKRRREIYKKLCASKEAYASKHPIPRLDVGTEVTIRYHSKAKPMTGTVIADDGSLTATVHKHNCHNQHETTRIPKRFLFVKRYSDAANLICFDEERFLEPIV